jgi:hypothetical protein
MWRSRLILGIYAELWMIGMLASNRVNPHTVDVVLVRPLPLLAGRGDPEPVGELRLFAEGERALATRLCAGAGESRAAS